MKTDNTYPTAAAYNQLRKQVGWYLLDENMIETAFSNSLYCVSVRHEGELIGFGRIIGDKSMFFSIHDVIVASTWQNKGIGKFIMTEIVNYLNNTFAENRVVELMAEKDKEGFYEQFGFLRRPNDFLGAGMTMLTKKDGNNPD